MYFWSVSLVDQLSSQFHIFLVDQFFFWSTKNQFLIFLVDQFFFWSTKNHFLMFLVDQFFFWSTKFIFSQPKKKLVDQKKWEIDRTIGRSRDWPKVHGRCFYLKLKRSKWEEILQKISFHHTVVLSTGRTYVCMNAKNSKGLSCNYKKECSTFFDTAWFSSSEFVKKGKVHIFWEGHKILRNLSLTFDQTLGC